MAFARNVSGASTRIGPVYTFHLGFGPLSVLYPIDAPCVGTYTTNSVGSVMESEAVTISRFHELTDGIAEQIALILQTLEQGKAVDAALERLVGTLFQNLALFRS